MSLNLYEIRILLADDDTDDCLFFEQAIVELTAVTSFTAVHDGEQLMHFLTNKTYELPHILFLDLNMPRKNGFECLNEIKQNEKLKNLPVVIFSTSFEQEVVNLLYENGAHYFIRKPSEFALFKKIIQHTLTLIIDDGNIVQPSKENFVLTVENCLTI
jgi:CheY-like chemotaxis protein